METKINKYKHNDEVSFEKRRLLGSSFVRGRILSYRYVNYNWVYLVECCDDKSLVTIPEDEIWPLKSEPAKFDDEKSACIRSDDE